MLWCDSVAPFGRAGGPGRVLNVDRVVAVQACLALGQRRFADRRRLVEQRLPAVVEDHYLLQCGTLGTHAVEDGGVVGGPEALRVQQETQPRLIDGVLELVRLVGRVDVDEDGADAGGRVLRDDPFVAVRRPDADPVALGDAACEQGRGQAAS